MSRYAATPAGQPGVAQAAAGSGFNAIPSAISFIYGTTTSIVTHVLEPRLTTQAYAGYSTVTITASRNAFRANTRLTRAMNSLDTNFSTPISAGVDDGRAYYESIGLISLAAKSQDDLYKLSDDIIRGLGNALPRGSYTSAKVGGAVTNITKTEFGAPLQKWKGAVTGIGAGIDFAVGFGFQIANDWGNPYLSSNQIGGRAIVAGGGSAISSFLGGFTGGAALGALCGPGVVICSPIGAVIGAVGGGVLWSEIVQPWIFQAPSFLPKRNLRPLGAN